MPRPPLALCETPQPAIPDDAGGRAPETDAGPFRHVIGNLSSTMNVVAGFDLKEAAR